MNVSVVIAACNPGPLLHETVESIASAADGVSYEVIVVNDQSTDGECDKLARHVKRIDTITRLGCSGSRNLGIEHATGEAIFIMDPHCDLVPGTLRKLATECSKRLSVCVPWLRLERRKRRGNYYAGLKLTKRGIQIERFHSNRLWPALGGAMYMISRETMSLFHNMPPLPSWWGGYEVFWTLVTYRFGATIVHHDLGKTCMHRTYRDLRTLPYDVEEYGRDVNERFGLSVVFPKFFPVLFEPILAHRYRRMKMDGFPPMGPDPYREEMERWVSKTGTVAESTVLEGPCRLKGLFRNPLVMELLEQ